MFSRKLCLPENSSLGAGSFTTKTNPQLILVHDDMYLGNVEISGKRNISNIICSTIHYSSIKRSLVRSIV